MKHFLLSIACLALAGSAFAESQLLTSVTCEIANQDSKVNTYDKTWTLKNAEGDVWNVANFSNNNNQWAYIKCGREKYESVATITTAEYIAGAVDKVVVNGNILPSVTNADGEVTKNYADYLKASLQISADDSFTTVTEVSFTLPEGAKNTILDTELTDIVIETPAENMYYRLVFNCEKAGTNGFVQIAGISYYGAPGEGPVLEAAGLAYEVETVTAMMGETVAVNPLTNPNELTVAYTSSNEEVATVAEDGALTLVGVGTTTITAASEATDKFRAGTASYTLTVVDAACTTLADFMEKNPEDKDKAYFKGELTAVYVNGAYVYVKDATAATLIYAPNNELKTGDVIEGLWEATVSIYNGLYELKPVATLPAAVDNVAVTYESVSEINEDLINNVVVLKNVTIDTAWPADTSANGAGTVGEGDDEQSVVFRNQFKIAELPEDGNVYDVTGAVAIYKTDLQFYPISFVLSSTSGVNSVAEEVVETYYNLQGVKVANPTKGLYIRVAGGKSEKIMK